MSRWNAGRRNLGAAGGNGCPAIVEGDEGNVHHAGAGMRTAPSLGRHTPRPPITAGAAAPAKIEVEVPPVAVWPEACPPQHSEAFLSLHRDGPLWMWTCHEAKDRDDYPTLFWRTSRPTLQELARKDSTHSLDQFFPEAAQELFFGVASHHRHNTNHDRLDDNDDDDGGGPIPVLTPRRAVQTAALRRVPVVFVFLLLDDESEQKAVSHLLKDLPVKIWALKSEHFVAALGALAEETGQPVSAAAASGAVANVSASVNVNNWTVDHVAAVFAGAERHGLPTLVVQAGTAILSYGTVDSRGRVVGGGAIPGIAAQLQAASSLGDAASNVSAVASWADLAGRCKARQRPPMSLLTTDCDEQRVAPILSSVAGFASVLVEAWTRHLATNQPTTIPTGDNDTPPPPPPPPVVVVGGVDANHLCDLLDAHHSHILQEGVIPSHPIDGWPCIPDKQLVPMGVHFLLSRQYALLYSHQNRQQQLGGPTDHTAEMVRDALLGCRIVKVFGRRPYRGTVESVARGSEALDQDLYSILFDDGDREELENHELYGCLHRYATDGEAWAELDSWKARKLEQKMEQSREARDLLAKHSPAVQGMLEKRSSNKVQPPAEALETNEIPPDDDRIGDASTAPTAAADATADAAADAVGDAVGELTGHPAPAGAVDLTLPSRKRNLSDGDSTTRPRAINDGQRGSPPEAKPSVVQAPSPQETIAKADRPVRRGSLRTAKAAPASPSPPKKKKTLKSKVESSEKAPAMPTLAVLRRAPESVVGRRVAKYFLDPDTQRDRLYYGTISQFLSAVEVRTAAEAAQDAEEGVQYEPAWRVNYDDGDMEDMEARQVVDVLRRFIRQAPKNPSVAKKSKKIK